MFKTRVLNQEVIEEVLDIKSVIKTVEEVYKLKDREEAALWPMIFHEFEPGVSDMDIKSGHLMGANVFGLKLVSLFEENVDKDLPPLIGTIMLYDGSTGAPTGILSASYVTGMRTAAAGAIGAKYLARKDSSEFLIVGAGYQAMFQIAAMLTVMDEIKKVRIYDPMKSENAEKLASIMPFELKNRFLSKYEDNQAVYEELSKHFNVEFEAVSDIEEATRKSDIVVTVTPSKEAIIKKEWVKAGTHFSCVGSDMPGKQEIDEKLFADAVVFVDDVTQACNVGEVEKSVKSNILKRESIREIGALLLEKTDGRTSDEDITIFDTTGIALQDLLTAKEALTIAEAKGLGQVVDI